MKTRLRNLSTNLKALNRRPHWSAGVGAILLITLLIAMWLIGKEMAPAESSAPDDLFLLAEFYFNHGPHADGTYDLRLARQYYEEALRDNPVGDNWAWYQLGRIDFLEGKFDDAIYKFNKQIQYFEDQQPAVYYMLGLTHGYKARSGASQDDWDQAARYFSQYLEHDADSPWARVDLAWVYFSQGRFEEMKPILEVGLKSHPDNPWLLNMYGLSLMNTGQVNLARTKLMAAKHAADQLTTEEWGSSYPGNDPTAWEEGLHEFRAVIENNLRLSDS